jgi:type III pantothenate kinase
MASLLIDIGNTNIKSALYSDGCLSDRRIFSINASDLTEMFETHWLSDGERPDKVLVSNVSTLSVEQALASFSKIHFDTVIEVVTPVKLYRGMKTEYEDPERLGVDRWLASLAAWLRCSSNVCVIDVGTALTVDVVTAGGLHLGGLIAPGPTLMLQSLASGAAELDREELSEVELFGTNTKDAISLGCLSAFGGIFKSVEDRLESLGLRDVVWHLTGGGAEVISAQIPTPFILVPDLVLDGLAEIN